MDLYTYNGGERGAKITIDTSSLSIPLSAKVDSLQEAALHNNTVFGFANYSFLYMTEPNVNFTSSFIVFEVLRVH